MSVIPTSAAAPCEGAVEDTKHWSGVAAGSAFVLHLTFDAAVYASDTFTVSMSRSSNGWDVVCREPQHTQYSTKAGGRSKYHVEKWCRNKCISV